MLSLRSQASRTLSQQLSRGFAQVVPGNPHPPVPASPASTLRSRRRRYFREKAEVPTPAPKNHARVAVKEDHGLYAFFRRLPGDNLTGEDRYEVLETPEGMRLPSGRAWEAAELRLKSFKDLHTLWYVAAREQNLLATQKEEVRRMGVTNPDMQVSMEKVRNCRKTMARIKQVLNERRLAYEGAMKLAEQQQAEAILRADEKDDWEVQEFLRQQQEEAALKRTKSEEPGVQQEEHADSSKDIGSNP